MRSRGEAEVKESGKTESMAAVMLVRFDVLSLAAFPSLFRELSEDRLPFSWSSWSDITLQSSLGAPLTEPAELQPDKELGEKVLGYVKLRIVECSLSACSSGSSTAVCLINERAYSRSL